LVLFVAKKEGKLEGRRAGGAFSFCGMGKEKRKKK
jgi:hypothetical protein